MADIKTNLRELSVLVGLDSIQKNIIPPTNGEDFFRRIKLINPEFAILASNLNGLDFNGEYLEIISNGYKLANDLFNKFKFSTPMKMAWFGYDTQKTDPIDIRVNNYDFSLKENSFILENMGLYKLINCFTGSNYSRGLHIFEKYSSKEYEEWFNVTWGLMVSHVENYNNYLKFNTSKKNSNKEALIEIKNESVYLNEISSGIIVNTSVLSKTPNFNEFKLKTSSSIREEVFSKWINIYMGENENYINAKKKCAQVASNNLASFLMNNLNYNAGINRFLRIHDKDYYYAKTTSLGTEIYHVPDTNSFSKSIEIVSIVGSVPNSQANILTTIRNLKTKQELVLRNECRFSHGQFNGTPEAKLYYEQGGSLLTIYDKV